MNIEAAILELERGALERWCAGDPSGFLEISDEDVVYFDPMVPERVDGLTALTEYYRPIRGKISAPRFEIINPKVQIIGDAAVLTYNFVSYGGSETAPRARARWLLRAEPASRRLAGGHPTCRVRAYEGNRGRLPDAARSVLSGRARRRDDRLQGRDADGAAAQRRRVRQLRRGGAHPRNGTTRQDGGSTDARRHRAGTAPERSRHPRSLRPANHRWPTSPGRPGSRC